MERGLGHRLRQVWDSRRPQCPASHSSLPTPVAIQEFLPALFLLAAGVSLAIFIMMTENLIRNHWWVIDRIIWSSRKFLAEIFTEN